MKYIILTFFILFQFISWSRSDDGKFSPRPERNDRLKNQKFPVVDSNACGA